MAFDKDKIDDLFSYHAPEPDQIPRYDAIRAAAKTFAAVLVANTPQSADQTAAIRKLRESVMTAKCRYRAERTGLNPMNFDRMFAYHPDPDTQTDVSGSRHATVSAGAKAFALTLAAQLQGDALADVIACVGEAVALAHAHIVAENATRVRLTAENTNIQCIGPDA